jgi:predicted double-glycine peptidase
MRLSRSLRVICLLIFGGLAGCSRPTSTEQSLFIEKYGDFTYCEMKVARQSDSKSCASASLTALLNYWGIETTDQQLLEEFGPPPRDGFSIEKLLAIAKLKDLQAYVFSMNPKPFEKLTEQIHKGRPIICFVKIPEALYLGHEIPLFGNTYRELSWVIGPRKNHFIVIFGTKDDKFLAMDPAFGFTTFSRNHLADAWGRNRNLVILCARLSQEHNTHVANRIFQNENIRKAIMSQK